MKLASHLLLGASMMMNMMHSEENTPQEMIESLLDGGIQIHKAELKGEVGGHKVDMFYDGDEGNFRLNVDETVIQDNKGEVSMHSSGRALSNEPNEKDI